MQHGLSPSKMLSDYIMHFMSIQFRDSPLLKIVKSVRCDNDLENDVDGSIRVMWRNCKL